MKSATLVVLVFLIVFVHSGCVRGPQGLSVGSANPPGSGPGENQNQNQSQMACTLNIDNAVAVPVAASGPTTIRLTVRPVPNDNGNAALTEVKHTGSSGPQLLNLTGSERLNNPFTIPLPTPLENGTITASYPDSAGLRVSCSASYQLAQAASPPPSPSGPLSYTNLGSGILGWDPLTGYWFKQSATGQPVAFAFWPKGPVYDFVRAGDFNGDGMMDVIGRNPSNGNFLVGIDGNFSQQPNIAFATDPAKPITNFRTAFVDANPLQDVLFVDFRGIEVAYFATIGPNGVVFGGPVPMPPTLALNGAPALVDYRGTAVLSWVATNVLSCNLKDPAGMNVMVGSGQTMGRSGSYTTPPLVVQSRYTLECLNPAQTAISTTFTVAVRSMPVATGSLTVNKDVVVAGGSVTVSTAAQFVDDCTLSKNGAVLTSQLGQLGSRTETINAQTNFSLVCHDYAGVKLQIDKLVNVAVVLTATPDQLEFGGVYKNTDAATPITTIIRNTHTALSAKDVSFSVPSPFSLKELICAGVNQLGVAKFDLAAGASCSAKVGFKPTAVQNYNLAMTVNFLNGVAAAALSVALRGQGLKPAGSK